MGRPWLFTIAIVLTCSAAPVHRLQERSRVAVRSAVLAPIVAEYYAQSRFPGAVIAARFDDGTVATHAVGLADRETRRPMPPNARMLAGSVGKTFFAALALEYSRAGLLDLDKPVSRYVRGSSWAARIPRTDSVTVRMLLTHTSGYGPICPAFMRDLAQAPLRERSPSEMLDCLTSDPPVAAPGAAFHYSDLNYILLARILETVSSRRAFDEIDRRFIRPLRLVNTRPALSAAIPHLTPGYAGTSNPFGGDQMLVGDKLRLNPQFEWAGGGFVSTAIDLAQWMAEICRSAVPSTGRWHAMTQAVDAPELGPGMRYGLGLVVEDTPAGRSYGHGGFFPGYVSWMRCYPDVGVSIAVQVNSSDDASFGGRVSDVLTRAAVAIRERGLVVRQR
jgi:D-alanyl-D-alanine carboxypeptidase